MRYMMLPQFLTVICSVKRLNNDLFDCINDISYIYISPILYIYYISSLIGNQSHAFAKSPVFAISLLFRNVEIVSFAMACHIEEQSEKLQHDVATVIQFSRVWGGIIAGGGCEAGVIHRAGERWLKLGENRELR